TRLESASMKVSAFIIVLAVTIICLGIFLSIYMASVIISPIRMIRHMVNDLGKGIIRKVDYRTSKNEIGEMVSSVNNLSEKLQATATFAGEVGNRNFDTHFEPLSASDTLGKALISMRDNLKQSDESLNEAQHIAHLGSWEWDVKNDHMIGSDELYKILETPKVMLTPNFDEFFKLIHPEDRDTVEKIVAGYLADKLPFQYECRLVINNGKIKVVFVHGKAILDAEGQVIKFTGVLQDISERKQGEEKLATERKLLQIMIENIPDQIYLKDNESRFLLCNMPVAKNAGCESQSDMIGKTDFDFIPEEIAREYFADEQALIKSGTPIINKEQHSINKLTGEPQWSLSTKVPLKDYTGKKIGLICINRDITQRKISEKKIEDVNRELSILFNSIDEVFFSVDMVNLKVIQISETCEKLYGYKAEDFMSDYLLWPQIVHPEDRSLTDGENEIIHRGEQVISQHRIIRKDNVVRWVEKKVTPTLDADGNLIRVDGVTSDITERKKAEYELQSSEERYRQIVETAQEGIWMIDENTNTTFVNKKWAICLGIRWMR
ncbi:MAG: PAS domain S-box protein, partial [Ferruginibacter sp.]